MELYLIPTLKYLIILIFAMAVVPKITGQPMAKEMFRKLGAEPIGRYVTAILEILAIVLLVFPGYLAWGALLSVLLMIGAIGSHLTKLGINQMFYMAIVVVLCAGYILVQTGLPL